MPTKSDEQHARLMDGLAASIREKGLAGTQVSDIVRHAHASRRTFYNHFEDKEACFVELMTTLADAFLAEVDRAIVLNPALEAFLSQDPHDATSLDESFARLGQILSEAA